VRALFGLLALLAAFAAGSASPSPALAGGPAVRPAQELAALLTTHAARRAPRRASTKLRSIASRRPITEGRTVLPVTGHATDAAGRHWLRVRLPGRPNGRTGWIEKAGTARRTTTWHIVVDISSRKVIVYRQGRTVRTFAAVVGRPSTPTPLGAFFVEEAVQLPSYEVGAPFALALSARSDVFQEFDGGPGQVAIHGLAHVGGRLGTAISHGCVRLDAEAMTWLVARITYGAPVTVRA
jgi:lipoprotein-anchoring transpeptidase ErfK/SrfK